MALTKKIAAISPSPTLAITAKAKKMKSEGIDIVALGAGEPDFDTPEHIKAAAITAIQEGFTKYTPAAGIPELKKAVINKLKRDNGLEYTPQEIVISCGAKHSLFNTILALFEEGDEVILPVPYWVTYPEQIKLAGATPVIVETRATDNFCLTADVLAANITPRTKGLIINTPNNPSGVVYNKNTLETLAKLALDNNIWVISDECYEKLVYQGEHCTIASLGREIKERTIVINAVSKAYSMTGWRIGYTAGPEEIITAIANLQSQSTSNPCSIAQKAAVAALNGPEEFLAGWRREFDTRRKIMVDGMNDIPGISCQAPGGAFYVFPDWSRLRGSKTPRGNIITTSSQLAEYLLEEAMVAVVPGNAFGSDDNLRLSYATSREIIQKGIQRIAGAVKRLTR